ncbi:MAG: GNAT family N-acetyltransferase [Thermoplasmata archaeon]
MRFLSFDELTPSMDRDRLLVHLAALGGAADRHAIRRWRRRSDLYSEYVGVFAVERGRVLGQTLVQRLAYTFPDGTEMIGAVASVGTRPDRARTGVARQILEEVHRREKEAGIRYIALWTNRSWGAHRLYEQLGYRDVYSIPWAVRSPRPDRLRCDPRVRPGRREDLPALGLLHARRAKGRLGFCRRPKRLLETAAAVRELDPGKELIVARERGEVSGYAYLDANPSRVLSGELVAGSQRTGARLVAEVERRAAGAAVAFQLTPVTDHRELFRQRGYVSVDTGWHVFMAAELGKAWAPRTAFERFRTGDSRFLCLSGDRF